MKQEIVYQRIEGAVLFIVASVLFFVGLKGSGLFYILLLFTPDLFMVGYGLDKKLGAHIYNLGHTLLLPALLALLSWELDQTILLEIALIWIAHIGMDRAFGYGLKTSKGFEETSLGRIGKSKSEEKVKK